MVPSEVIADAWHDRTLDMEKRRQLLAELKVSSLLLHLLPA